MSTSGWMLAGALVALAACSVPALETSDKQPSVPNTCKADSDCGPMGICAGSTMCVASTGEIETLVVEIVPPASAHFGAGDSFVQELDLSSGANPRDLTLPSYADVTGKVLIDSEQLVDFTPLPQECQQIRAGDGSFQVHVAATRTDTGHGLPVFATEANAVDELGVWRYHLSLPPAFYDLTIAFLGGCPLPPIFLPKQDFTEGVAYVYPTTLSAISKLSGSIEFTPPASLENWTIELIEPVAGKRISTVKSFGAAAPLQNFFVHYLPIAEGKLVPLLELTPPKDVVAPSILWDLSVIDFDNNGIVGLDITQLKWSSATVRARVETASTHAAIAGASVTLRSTGLADAPDGLTAFYETTVQSGEDGMVEAKLVPGTYRLVVVPPDATNAIRQEVWTVAASPTVQAGRTILLEPAISVNGLARDPIQGAGIGGVEIDLTPWGKAATVLEISLGLAGVLPRRATGTSAADGSFAVGVDPGTFLFSARTDESTGFPWLVRTSVEVKADGPQPLALGAMAATYPQVVEGTLRDAWGPIQQARMRAYAPLSAGGSSARKGDAVQGAVQIAETRSNEAGHFRLLLPAQLQK